VPVIAGVVTDVAGEPVAGARVMVSKSPVAVPDIAVLSDAGGAFVLGAPVPGPYELTVATDDVVTQAPVEVGEGAERADVRVTLAPGP
jgi:Carboxypeptidase regulatory-like domain